jgi:endonuclease YncB( thermonuclease family)
MILIMVFGVFAAAVSSIFPVVSTASDIAAIGRILWVIDGDTYRIAHAGAPDGEPVRARHFDTPEKGERARCEAERLKAGRAEAMARSLLSKGAVVGLSNPGRDRYGRLLATITLADGRDLAGLMIGAGIARPYDGGRRSSWCGEAD